MRQMFSQNQIEKLINELVNEKINNILSETFVEVDCTDKQLYGVIEFDELANAIKECGDTGKTLVLKNCVLDASLFKKAYLNVNVEAQIYTANLISAFYSEDGATTASGMCFILDTSVTEERTKPELECRELLMYFEEAGE